MALIYSGVAAIHAPAAAREGSAASGSFHNFFAGVGKSSVNTTVENAFNNAIDKIGAMPSPFVKYCSVIWNKNFDDPTNWESTTEE